MNHIIINTSATIDHDCIIEDYCHIAPGVNLAGGVLVNTGTLMGIASCATPYTKIGAWVTVGAGATVINDIDEGLTVVGTPARRLSE
jgi:acyl-[acyl carrier protein]--UDP-N-acetylglucosamine O-acyltransferase